MIKEDLTYLGYVIYNLDYMSELRLYYIDKDTCEFYFKIIKIDNSRIEAKKFINTFGKQYITKKLKLNVDKVDIETSSNLIDAMINNRNGFKDWWCPELLNLSFVNYSGWALSFEFILREHFKLFKDIWEPYIIIDKIL